MDTTEKPISALMQKHFFAVHVEDPIEKVERLFRIHREAYALVMDEEGEYFGLITATNLLGFQLAWKKVGALKAREICCPRVIAGGAKMKVREAAELMLRKAADFLIVMEAGKVLGLVSSHNLLRELLLELNPSCFKMVDEKGIFFRPD